LARLGFVVRLLNDAEKDAIKEVKPVMSTADVETIKRVLEEMAKMARIVMAKDRGRVYIRVIPYDKSKVEEIVAKLSAVGIRVTVLHKKREVRIHERRSVETIREIAPALFALLHRSLHFAVAPQECCSTRM